MINPQQQANPWRRARFPAGNELWHATPDISFDASASLANLSEHLGQIEQCGEWQWPDSPVFFVSDVHADGRALVESLAMADLVVQTGTKIRDFELTSGGRESIIVIGGDCLDKGPSNLKLLDTIRELIRQGAQIQLLAGNHDLRLPLGLHCFSKPVDVFSEHLFVRMGAKTMPLLAEIWQRRLKKRRRPLKDVPDKKTCKRLLMPKDCWPERFRVAAKDKMLDEALDREINRIMEKSTGFRATYKNQGMSIRQVYAAAREAHRLFIDPKGKYAWFLQSLDLMWRQGSFLFVHAGLDDSTATLLCKKGINHVNAQFKKEFTQDPFTCYSGSLGNSMRTKYRPVDYPLSERGVRALHNKGVFAIVHGHRSNRAGQRLALRSGLLHVEGDVTLDRNTRRTEGFDGPGAGIIEISPEGLLIGKSADHKRCKVFSPTNYPLRQESPAL